MSTGRSRMLVGDVSGSIFDVTWVVEGCLE
jgi:hypothetical protein